MVCLSTLSKQLDNKLDLINKRIDDVKDQVQHYKYQIDIKAKENCVLLAAKGKVKVILNHSPLNRSRKIPGNQIYD